MFLAIDVGNSHISFGVFQRAKLTHHLRCQSQPFLTTDELASFLLPHLEREGIDEKSFEAVGVCSVVPTVNSAVTSLSTSVFGRNPIDVREKIDFGVAVDYAQEVGADRLANAAYANARLELPAAIIDFGTAITIDVVGKDGAYQGGAILPGVRLAMESLGKKTAQLPLVDLSFPERVIGKNTKDCIRSGVLFGYADLLKGQVERIEAEMGTLNSLVLTGGFSALFQEQLGRPVDYDPHLTLQGIEILCSKR